MGQKVNPHGLRVGIIKDWDSRWFADKKEFGDLLVEDHKIRKLVKKEVSLSGVPKVEIERSANRVKVTVFTAKPGMVIGKSGIGSRVFQSNLQGGVIDCLYAECMGIAFFSSCNFFRVDHGIK